MKKISKTKYYKVVRAYDDNTYVSEIVSQHRANIGIQYKIGEFVSANIPGSYLYVYNDKIILDVLKMCRYNSFKIFEVEVKGILHTKAFYVPSLKTTEILDMWKRRHQHKRYKYLVDLIGLPQISMVKEVKLIKEVD